MEPDVGEASVAHVVEGEPGDGLGGVARECLAGRRDVDAGSPPAAHAGFGPSGVIVGHHEIDDEDALEARTRLLHQLDAVEHLPTRGHEGLAVLQRPAVVLHVRHLEPPRAEPHGQLDDGGQAVDVLAMHRRVDGER